MTSRYSSTSNFGAPGSIPRNYRRATTLTSSSGTRLPGHAVELGGILDVGNNDRGLWALRESRAGNGRGSHFVAALEVRVIE